MKTTIATRAARTMRVMVYKLDQPVVSYAIPHFLNNCTDCMVVQRGNAHNSHMCISKQRDPIT